MSSVVVVLPNVRGVAYLRQALVSALDGKTALLPAITSMDELVRHLVPEQVVDGLTAQMVLFQSFRKFKNENETFETFFPLGQMLFSDFEEITRNLKPLDLIYRNLADWESTGVNFSDFLSDEQKVVLEQFWSHFSDDKITALRQRFIQLWRALPQVFEDFKYQMALRNELTSAMAYALAPNQVVTNSWIQSKTKILFAGFGDLSESEKQLMVSLDRYGKLDLMWDFNSLFEGNQVHEVSRLIDRLQRNHVLTASVQTARAGEVNSNRPKVQIIHCQGYAGMAHWLKEKSVEQKNTSAAFVLTDPALVHTLIQQTDFDNEKYNFTMGFPLAYTGVVALINRIFAWNERERKDELASLTEVLNNQTARRLLPYVIIEWERWEEKLAGNPGDFEVLKAGLSSAPSWLWAEDALVWVSSFLDWWAQIANSENASVYERGAYPKVALALEQLLSLVQSLAPEQINWKVIRLLWTPILYQHSIAIEGSMKEGVQVLGLYETRVLDFDHVIIAPAEEGKIPGSGQSQTFLTENLRKAFGLPTRSQQVEDELYQFYRLCYRSSQITLLVNQGTDTKPSRILDQIRYSDLFDFEEIYQQYGYSIPVPKPITVEKNEAVNNWIAKYYNDDLRLEEKALSPSFLHNLLNCSLKAYFKGFEKLKEPDLDKALEMSPRDFGNWVHRCIQTLYEQQQKPGSTLNQSDYTHMKDKWESVQHLVWSALPDREDTKPLDQYRIEKEAGKVMAFRFFDFMALQQPHEWKANEQLLSRAYLETENLPGKQWAVEGRADLVLEAGNEHWIIDLKTGSFSNENDVKINPSKLERLEMKCKSNKDVFQMLIYNWLNTKAFPDNKTRTFLFYMADPDATLLDPLHLVQSPVDQENLDRELESMLSRHLESWFDTDQMILQTDDLQVCSFCEFQAICQR